MRPKIGHASVSEIEAVLPPELREEPKPDEKAEERMDKLLEMSRYVKNDLDREFGSKETTIPRKFEIAQTLWSEDEPLFTDLKKLVAEGALRFRPVKDFEAPRDDLANLRNLVKRLASVGLTFAENGDFVKAQINIDLALKVADAVYHGGGDEMAFLVSTSSMITADAAVEQAARLPSCPPDICTHWLELLSEKTSTESLLPAVFREEFRDSALPLLDDADRLADVIVSQYEIPAWARDDSNRSPSRRRGLLFGTLDPVETAKTLSHLVTINEINAVRPLSAYDGEFERIRDAEVSGLPEAARQSLGLLTFQNLKFRFLMNNTKNSLGRAMVYFGLAGMGKAAITVDCRFRAQHELTRVLLATVLYRKDHSGNLPENLAELAPKYLPNVPIDPFNGKPLLLNRTKEVAYSVGRNLKDDGGEIVNNKSGLAKDVGLSLAIGP